MSDMETIEGIEISRVEGRGVDNVLFDEINAQEVAYNFERLPSSHPDISLEELITAVVEVRSENPESLLNTFGLLDEENIQVAWDSIRPETDVSFKDHIWARIFFNKIKDDFMKFSTWYEFYHQWVDNLSALPPNSKNRDYAGIYESEGEIKGAVAINVGWVAKCLRLGERGKIALMANLLHGARHVFWRKFYRTGDQERETVLRGESTAPELTVGTASHFTGSPGLDFYYEEEDCHLFEELFYRERGINVVLWDERAASYYWNLRHNPGEHPKLRNLGKLSLPQEAR